VPVYEHAFGKRMAPFEVRRDLCQACFRGITGIEVSELEVTLERPSYTVRALERLTAEHPDWELRTLVGSDILAETHAWREFERVEALAPLFVLPRLGHDVPGLGPAVLPEVSSSEVRALFADRKRSPDAARRLEWLVPEAVRIAVEKHGIYASLE
jgi:nicotinate-nucleotide adenylyltransferase